MCLRQFTKTAQSTGLENIGLERMLLGLPALVAVNSLSRITLENNRKIGPPPNRENAFAGASGGGSGIRTHETVSRLPVFKTGAFNHSAIPPGRASMSEPNPVFKPVFKLI